MSLLMGMVISVVVYSLRRSNRYVLQVHKPSGPHAKDLMQLSISKQTYLDCPYLLNGDVISLVQICSDHRTTKLYLKLFRC